MDRTPPGLVVISILAVFIGWVVVHELDVRRDQVAYRREIETRYLIEAYRTLHDSANREVVPDRHAFEAAMADIQLFGTTEQVALAIQVGETLDEKGTVTLNELLEKLRDDLREELGLEQLEARMRTMRFDEE